MNISKARWRLRCKGENFFGGGCDARYLPFVMPDFLKINSILE